MRSSSNIVSEDLSEHDMMTPTMRVAKGGAIALVGLLVGKTFTFGTEVFLARFLGVSEYGVFSLARTIVMIPNLATDLGLPQGVVRFGSIYRDKNDLGKLKGLLLSSLQIASLVGFLVSILIFLEGQTAASWFNEPALQKPVRILAWIIAPSGIVTITAAFFRSQLKFKTNVVIGIIYQPLITLVFSLVFIALFGYGLEGAVFAILGAALTNALIGLFLITRAYSSIFSAVKSNCHLKTWLRFSLPTFLLGVSFLLLRYTGRLLLGYFGKAELVGVFTAAGALAENLTLFLLAFNPIFAPLVSRFHERGDLKELAYNFKVVSRWQLTLTLPIGLMMLVYPGELMWLFGSDFQAGSNVLTILVLAQLVNVGTGPVGMVLQMTSHQDIELGNGIAAFLVNLLLGVELIPQYGALGAGLATALSLSLIHLARLVEVYLFLGMLPYDKSTLKCVIAFITSYLVISLLNKYAIIDNVFFEVVIGVFVIFVVYLITLVFLKFDENDREFFRKMKKSYLSRLNR